MANNISLTTTAVHWPGGSGTIIPTSGSPTLQASETSTGTFKNVDGGGSISDVKNFTLGPCFIKLSTGAATVIDVDRLHAGRL